MFFSYVRISVFPDIIPWILFMITREDWNPMGPRASSFILEWLSNTGEIFHPVEAPALFTALKESLIG